MTMDDLPEAVGIPAPSSDADEGLHRPGVTGSIPRVQSADDSQDTHGGSDGATESSTASPFEKTATDLVPGHGFVRAPTHYKELAPLVAMLPPSDAVAHNRLAKQSYSRLGRNLLFEARPAVRLCVSRVVSQFKVTFRCKGEEPCCCTLCVSSPNEGKPMQKDERVVII